MHVWRPDGMSMESYKGWETWERNRWAWEFLRRNSSFQAGCDNASSLRVYYGENDPDAVEMEELSVAFRFGLSRFKHYAEPFEGGSAFRPQFRRLISVRRGRAEGPANPLSARVIPGELFVKISVKELRSKQDLEDHVRWYRRQLQRLQEEVVGKPLPGRGRTQAPSVYLQFLRFLDGDQDRKSVV